jgi:hypothetical protein
MLHGTNPVKIMEDDTKQLWTIVLFRRGWKHKGGPKGDLQRSVKEGLSVHPIEIFSLLWHIPKRTRVRDILSL